MNNLIFWLYIANIVDSVKNSIQWTIFFFILVFIILGMLCLLTELDERMKNIFNTYIKIAIIPFILCILLNIFCPTSKFLYMVIGLKTAEIGIENMQGLEEFNKARKILNLKLDELLEENKQKN